MFLFFGWGSKHKSWSLEDGNHLMVTWSYFHLFFIPVAFNKEWHLLGNNRDEDKIISYHQVKEMFPEETPKLNKFNEFGLLYVIGGFIFLNLISGLSK